jgi:hypothetical protein
VAQCASFGAPSVLEGRHEFRQGRQRCEWSLADTLYKEVGHRGSETRFEQCREYLAAHGIEHTANYLRHLHSAARIARDGQPSWATPEHVQAAASLDVIEAAVVAEKKRAKEEGVEYEPPTKRGLQPTRKAVVRNERVQS